MKGERGKGKGVNSEALGNNFGKKGICISNNYYSHSYAAGKCRIGTGGAKRRCMLTIFMLNLGSHVVKYMVRLYLFFSILTLSVVSVYSQSNLEDFIDSAFARDPVLFENRNNILITENDEKLFRAGLKSQVGFTTDLAWDPVLHGYGYDEIITNGQVISTLVNFDREILFKGQMDIHEQSYSIRKSQAGNQLQISRAELRKEVTSRYLTAWGDFMQWQYNSAILGSLQREDSLLLRLTKANVYRQTDYYTFLASLKSQQITVNAALLQYRRSLMDLRYLSGIADTAFIRLSNPDIARTDIPSKLTSIYFQQFVIDSMRLQSLLDLIDLEYQPKMSVHADAGYLSSLMMDPYKNFGVGVGLKFSIPIYDGRQKEIKYENVNLRQENNRQRQTYFARQYDLKLAALKQEISDLQKQAVDIDNQVRFYQELMDAEENLISSGQLDISQYFLLIRNFIDLSNESAKNKVKRMMVINEINYLAN